MAILLYIPAKASAYPISYELNFPTVQQERSLWCWAASCCAVIEYYGRDVSQEGFVFTLRGNTINAGGNMQDMQRGLANFSINSRIVSSALTLAQIRMNTYSSRRPVIAGIAWTAGGGHAVVVIGYIDDPNLDDRTVIYMDPWYGEIFTGEYSEFVSSDTQTWIESLTNIS